MTSNKSKRLHSTPGVYFSETVVDYTSKSLGITTLGLVGETLKGPAFQPLNISSWNEFKTYFGGTSTKKFKGSQYPKYEAPYIAKSYLEQSKQLEMVRVLGLSGVNAGPAWVMTGSYYKDGVQIKKPYNNTVFMVLRSRGEHKKSAFVSHADPDNGICDDVYSYDGIEYYATKIELVPSVKLNIDTKCNPGFSKETGNFNVNMLNLGNFTIQVTDRNGQVYKYDVSLNPGDNNYIYNVLGNDPYEGESLIYVDELYDVALEQLILKDEINTLNRDLVYYPEVYIVPKHEDVNDILFESESNLKKINVGERYLFVDEIKATDEDGKVIKDKDGNEIIYGGESKGIKVHYSFDQGKTWVEGNGKNGWIYTVVEFNNNGNREYFYGSYAKQDESGQIVESDEKEYESDILKILDFSQDKDYLRDKVFNEAVRVVADDMYYIIQKRYAVDVVVPVTLDFNNYREPYRYASTPWIISELRGSGMNIDLHKLFRFHTISDGNNANKEIKISIENIMPEDGTFDVLVRDFIDSDGLPKVIERFNKCSLVPGSQNYIGLKIGTFDGTYNQKSSYITVEINEDSITPLSIPAGFMGYPVRDYHGIAAGGSSKISYSYNEFEEVQDETVTNHQHEDGKDYISGKGEFYKWSGSAWEKINNITFESIENSERDFPSSISPLYGKTIKKVDELDVDDKYYALVESYQTVNIEEPYFKYNTTIDTDLRPKKQYFGISNLVGIDTDILSYKGIEAYNNTPYGLSDCFHLDSRIDGSVENQNVTIDGIGGYTWSTVDRALTLKRNDKAPQIGTETEMEDTIYAEKRYRKFTVAFYGGFDGWDYYRTSRSNTDEFKYNQYKGSINQKSGYGSMFTTNVDMDSLGFDNTTNVITSDYYAYLAGVRQLSNPNSLEINILATPGIDYVYNNMLTHEIIDMVEDERADLLYVMTTPDKPRGAGDSKFEMFSAEEVVANLDASDIDSSYCCTYYPWGKYYDSANSQYIYLPITRDVVRSMAYTENIAHSWFPAAGWDRGNISAIEPRKKLKKGETDIVYDGRINFIYSFAKDGDKIWGDKNLQIEENLMNRISKRKLILRLKKLCSNACVNLIFDPNDKSCAKTLESTLKSIMEDVKAQRGIHDYKITIDNSDENLDNLTLVGYVQIHPTSSLEYIDINFAMTPSGVSFT